MKDLTLSDLLRQANINTENQLMDFSNSSWKYFIDIGTSIWGYMIFYQFGVFDHGTHVTGPVAQKSAENE